MGWTINGVPFRGDIITVGPSGRDFASVFDALVAVRYDESLDDVLLLVDPATYTCPADLGDTAVTGKRVCVRGMGDTPDQTVIFKNHSYGQLIIISRDGTAIFENCNLHNGYAWRHSLTIAHNAQVVVNKALVSAGRSAYPVSSVNLSDFTGSMLFSNAEIRKGYIHATGYSSAYKLNLATISLSRVKLDSTWNSIYVYGELALADYVTTPTEGYGYNYGDFLITEGGGGIAAKEQYYRRLRNG